MLLPPKRLLEAAEERAERLKYGFGPNPHPYAALIQGAEPENSVVQAAVVPQQPLVTGERLQEAITTAAAASVAAAEARAKEAEERAEGFAARNAELKA